ncbi:hypothetical protein C0993_001707 [Termitomyces sp. T159_Od127]|nr:hypothetical protein C0993_001707 [Termitomyces sp. T159_Od127]
MPSASGNYDEALLATAPTSTKAQRQEGYSTDLLNSSSGTATPPISTTQVDVEHGLAQKEYNGAYKRPTPFFRTRKGIIIIAVLVIVILAAIIGGAVGGSVHHHNQDELTSVNGSSGLGASSNPNATTSTATPASSSSDAFILSDIFSSRSSVSPSATSLAFPSFATSSSVPQN